MKRNPERRKRRLFDARYVAQESRRHYNGAFILFWSLLLFFVFQRHVISLGLVSETSMDPTLKPGEMHLINKYIYLLRAPRRGEIVVLMPGHFDRDEYVKRVIAVGGDTVSIRNGSVELNGKPLGEPYAHGATSPSAGPITIEPGCFFVLGDNREGSIDSRRFGPVPAKRIQGKIDPRRLFPLN